MCLCLSRKKGGYSKNFSSNEEKERRFAVFQSGADLTNRSKVESKTPEEEIEIKSAIENNDFINRIISYPILNEVVAAMYKRKVKAGEIIIKQGNKGTHMYVSCKGTFEVIKKNYKTQFEDVRIFGELAILYDAKRFATVMAITDAEVWVLDAPVYQQLLIRNNVKEQQERVNFLVKNNVMKDADTKILNFAANELKSEFFTDGKTIVKEGEKGNKFYIVRAGTVTVSKKIDGVLGSYSKGYCFGERALLAESRRQATVTANPPLVECLSLSRKVFFELTEYLKVQPIPLQRGQSQEYKNIELEDLDIVSNIGIGGFGRIDLAKHKENQKLFALKYMSKINIVTDKRQQHAINERIQLQCDSPFILSMYKTFKDNRYIYYLLEVCPAGDLWNILYRETPQRNFSEREAKFIVGCVLEALTYLHSKEIIFRDLKPENVLLTSTGYFKLTDFGYAKKLSKFEKTLTFAGTVEYVAPEIAMKKSYNRAVDFWACGIFIFEMLCGKTPFTSRETNENKIFERILSGIDTVLFPTAILPIAKDLILKLCRPNPSDRLGMEGGVLKIKYHKWFSGFNWTKLQKLEMESPLRDYARKNRLPNKLIPDPDPPAEEMSGWDEEF